MDDNLITFIGGFVILAGIAFVGYKIWSKQKNRIKSVTDKATDAAKDAINRR